MVDCSTCLLMCSCPIVVFLGFSRCLLMSFSVRPGQVTRKPCLISLRRIDVVGLKSYACKYCAVTGLVLLDTIYETHDNNNKNSTNSCNSVDILALATHSVVEVSEGIPWSINYAVYIMATYPLDKGTGLTEIRKKYIVHVS